MIKRAFLTLAILVFVHIVFISPVIAQLPTNVPTSCVAQNTRWATDGKIKFGWFFLSAYPGTFAYLVGAMACPRYPPPSRCPKCTEPISVATGETSITQRDISIPGLGGGLTLDRTWNSSIWPGGLSQFQTGIFGPNWRSTYEERIVMCVDGWIRYIRSDATFWEFIASTTPANGDGWIVGNVANIAATFNSDTFKVTFPNGEQRTFDSNNGNLLAISDRNGNTTYLTYDSSGRLSTVTDAASRTLTFNYNNAIFTNLVTSVTSSVGVSYSYSYDSQGRLTQVTKPDQTTLSFTYNSQSLITAVTDSNGKTLESHTYDSQGRGLTGSRANGVEAVTLTYPQ